MNANAATSSEVIGELSQTPVKPSDQRSGSSTNGMTSALATERTVAGRGNSSVVNML